MLKSFKNFISLLIFLSAISILKAEDQIDIWKDKKKDLNTKEVTENNSIEKSNSSINQNSLKIENVSEIKEGSLNYEASKVFGVYDPADYNFNINMWSSTNAEDVRSSVKRLKKIKLSKTSNDIFENILLSFSYPPVGMSEKEFVNLKINWLIENDRSELIESFLKQNKDFPGKSKAVQYLVDEKITQANIKEGCEKIEFIDSTIKDSYLEKFKIYCLVFENKKSEARLLLDLLREQNQSDKFFDDKINFLLGISDKTTKKINEKNLLNFYLSSVTIKDFNYEPNKKTKKEIWKYLNAANLIKLDDFSDKEKIRELELASNQGQVDSGLIFNIYKQITFDLNSLINAKNIYQSLENVDSRALIYQKYLLSEDLNSKFENLFLLENLFLKDGLSNIYNEFLDRSVRNIGLEKIPEKYKEISLKIILKEENSNSGKVKYNDKILHQSKIIRFYLENVSEKKIQKEIDRTFKKLSKNKKYFFSAKDLALAETLIKDGFKIPTNFKLNELTSKYDVPKNLFNLIEKKQNAFLALKIVEIIGEDEPHELDPETIYFITNLLNETNLITIRNKVLISALPLRV
tara:strand:- start:8232 stop:9962 length:1731 start_codon:yes stop_codon:yes gene_type:complete